MLVSMSFDCGSELVVAMDLVGFRLREGPEATFQHSRPIQSQDCLAEMKTRIEDELEDTGERH